MDPNNPTDLPAPEGNTPAPEGNTPWYQSDAIPADWRDQVVQGLGLEGDAAQARLNQLGRFQSLDKVFDSFFQAQDKIRAGEAAAGPQRPADDAPPEKWAEYREAVGLPATPEDYELKLEDGLVLGDEDKTVLNEVFKAAHANDVKPETVNALTNAMLTAREKQIQQVMDQHGLDQQQTTAHLRQHWGSDYQANINVIQGLVNQLPEGTRELFENATTAEGKLFFNDPNIMQWMADLGRKLNPMGAVAPGSANPVAATQSRIAEIEKMRDNGDKEYWSPSVQQEYDRLLQAQMDYQQLQKRGG